MRDITYTACFDEVLVEARPTSLTISSLAPITAANPHDQPEGG
jgi:hypothetical protein